MYLIPLDNDAVYYNSTTFDASSLATIFLLAIAYHPSYSNLLYLLYGCTSLALPGSTYGNINIMVKDMVTRQFLQNSTISQNIQCLRDCEIKVTDNLFLIQSQSYIAIYRLYSDQLVDVISPAATYSKGTTYWISGLTRQADIFKNKYMVSNLSSVFTFGQVISSGTTIYTFLSDVNITNVLFVGMTESWVFAAVNHTDISVILYNCVPCIFDGALRNSSNISKIVIATNTNVSYSYRFYQGMQTSESNVTNAYIFVGIGDGVTRKYYINPSNYQQDAVVTSYTIAASSQANYYQYLSFGSSILISRQFAYNLSDQNVQIFSFTSSIYLLALSSSSKVLALHTGENTWNVQQYQMVSDCSQYTTNITNTTQDTHFCSCYRYNSSNFCAFIGTSTSSSGGSFPITAVIGVVAGVVMIAVSVIVIKKNYKRCLKRHRTPWKYNPVELMSFQV